MEGDQYCPFCDGETEESLKEHGKICPDYQETVSQNICPFCATQIDECYVEQHFKYREVMKISKCPFSAAKRSGVNPPSNAGFLS